MKYFTCNNKPARVAMTLLVAMLTTTTVWAQQTIPFTESFGTSKPEGWSMYFNNLNQVQAGTATLQSTDDAWNFGSANGVFDNHAYAWIYSFTSRWLVTPLLNLTNNLELTFSLALTSEDGDLNEPNTTDGRFIVLVSTDGMSTWTILREWNNSGSSYVYNDIPHTATGEDVSISLSEYANQNVYIAFYAESSATPTPNQLHLDNVSVDHPICKTCQVPTDVIISNITAHSATVTWTSDDTEFDLLVGNNLIEGVTSPYTLTNLDPETTYSVRVRANYGDNGYSQWSNEITFTPTNTTMLTVNDGTGTNNYVPVYGFYVDNKSYSQFIIPAAKLADMQWGTIKKMTFYSSSTNVPWTNAQFEVYMTETTETTLSALADWGTMEKVMNEAHLEISGNQMVVTLDEPYQYMGGNLLIGIKQTVSGTYASASFYGVSADTGASMGGYGTSVNKQNFLPKTTFAYIPGTEPTCFKPTGLTVNYEGGTEATISWTSDAEAWNIDVNGTVTAITENPYTLTGLELATLYEVKVQANCGDNNTSVWTNAVSFTTDLCMPENMCEITFELTDSWGDGWNGAYIEVVDMLTGNSLGKMANENLNGTTGSGENEVNIKTLRVCNSREIQFVWHSGSYDSEASYVVTDINDEVIFEGSGAMSEPVNYTVNCTVTACLKPTDLAAGTPEAHEVELSWTENGEATSWQICINGDEENLINVNVNPYTLKGLTADTDYSIKIRAYCDADHQSRWSNAVAFTTAESCAKPTDLAENNISTNSADLNWDGTSDSYVLQYRTAAHNNMNLWEQVGEDVIATATLTQYTFDLSSYSGTGNIAIRHYNVSDMFRLAVDDIVVTNAGGETVVSEGFEDGSIPSGWTNYDYDGDGYAWKTATFSGIQNGSYCVYSESYDNDNFVALTPDNWLIIPDVELGGTLTLYARGTDTSFPQENFGVFVTTASLETVFQTTPAGEWSDEISTTDTSKKLTGLTANTPYEWQVKGVCGESEESSWASSSFTTLPEGFKTFITAGDWNVADNWLPAGVPTSDDEVSIEAAVTIPAGVVATAKRATLNGGSILIKDGGQLKQGAATLRVTIEKEITGYGEGVGKYSFISSPFSGRTLYEASGTWSRVDNLFDGDYDFYTFDSSADLEWINYKASPTHISFKSENGNVGLMYGEGYLYANAADKTLQFVGTTGKSVDYTETRDVTYDETSTDVFNGRQIVGNFFSCNAYVYYADADGNKLPATFYKMNTAGDGLEEVNGNVVVLKPCEGALMLVNTSGKIVWSTEPVSGSNNTVSGSLLPLLPEHDKSADMDADNYDITIVDDGENSQTISNHSNHNDYLANVTLSGRTLYTDGDWNTLCLPFGLSATQIAASPLAGADIRAFSSAEFTEENKTLTLNFTPAVSEGTVNGVEPVTSIVAGTPYIFKWGNFADAVTYSGISGSSGYNDGNGKPQGYQNLIDGNTSTKWCASTSHQNNGEWICEFSSSAPVSVTGYTLTTGNDTKTGNNGNGYENRNPRVWTLEAKVNSSWTTIDSRNVNKDSDDALPMEDFGVKSYDIATDKQGTYQYFRFVVSATGGNEMQLSELKLQGTAIVNPVFTNVTISDEEHPATINVGNGRSVVFKGTYDMIPFTSDDHHTLLLGWNSTLYWPESGASIGACRAYFQLNGIQVGDISNGVRLNFGGEETGIISIENGKLIIENDGDGWFTIDGKKLDKAPVRKGLYIHDGHKVVIK